MTKKNLFFAVCVLVTSVSFLMYSLYTSKQAIKQLHNSNVELSSRCEKLSIENEKLKRDVCASCMELIKKRATVPIEFLNSVK